MRLFILVIMTTIFLISTSLRAEFDSQACEQVVKSTANVVDCQLSFSTNTKEQEEVKKKSYGIIHHLTCSTQLNVLKNELVNALLGSSQTRRETNLSPHQINCGIQTNGDYFEIGLTIAPWIQFDNGVVSRLQLNINEVTGVPPLIGKPLMKYGNAPQLQEKAKEALNNFLNTLIANHLGENLFQ